MLGQQAFGGKAEGMPGVVDDGEVGAELVLDLDDDLLGPELVLPLQPRVLVLDVFLDRALGGWAVGQFT